MSSTAEQINAAIGAHGMWKLRLKTAITSGAKDLDSRTVSQDCECAFGKWLYGPEIDARTRASMPYQVVKRLHQEFHHSAGRVVQAVECGQNQAAKQLMESDFVPRSEKLVRALMKWKGEVA
ncbi:CZB domain-containing protein [Alteraurantiacibacter palmitatis]|uniref:CZB domain-containing protein n=1 Tax=Alteraurantiacibacter palmitatis TaxID=2054628 RepID=A0ABV7E545_9SPHN